MQKKDLKITRLENLCKNKFIKIIERNNLKKKFLGYYLFLVNNSKLRKKIFNFGWKNGFSIISWPTLPKQLVNKENKKIWSKLVCFETDRAPNNQKKTF